MQDKIHQIISLGVKMFSYEHLAAFCATYEEGSYSKAARKLNKERTTVRDQIKAIEDSFCVELFIIEGKQALPTQQAKALYRQAKVLVKNSDLLYERMINAYQKPFDSLVIYHDALVPSSIIKDINRLVKNALPTLRLHWLQRNRDEVIDALIGDSPCFAIMQSKLKNLPERPFRYNYLGTVQHHFYCGANHVLANQCKVHIDELEIETQYITESYHNSNADLFSISTDLRVVSNNEVLLELLGDDGWAILNRSVADKWVSKGILKELPVSEVSNALRIPLSLYCSLEFEGYQEVQLLESIITDYTQSLFW
ncbi:MULTISPECIES: LysR family transcriptional regulator [Vibrio]|jgi:DNA-binding transcriptional LysR family regulator|uniref:LysR family transcriptional regulator n=1 Tax=Vibrio bivalvicida TaxID=1276888 RepID=A0ABV4MJX0_9VIBR|nr:LysR family transcriptional regulator [Vibrio alfacsensis]WQE78342.1 LysR family transcriptional regulator [Vibrio alfacsensis]